MRDLDFQFDNLERRSLNGNFVDGTNVALWTNHRVMEWLRVVDLAEYAPNLRGSGVHGSLMVYEGRFTAELLATLLSISPAKSLLRRHLVTHFNELLGKDIVQHKREVESSPGFIPLTITARLKVNIIFLSILEIFSILLNYQNIKFSDAKKVTIYIKAKKE